MPGTLSVVGYDDIDLARFVSPQLTTMAVDKLGMGRLAVTLLLHRLEFGHGAMTQAFIRPRLVDAVGPSHRRAGGRDDRDGRSAWPQRRSEARISET